MTISEFPIRYDSWFVPLATAFGLGRRRAGVRIGEGVVTVRLGWAFRARIPLNTIRSAGPDSGGVTGWGVHGFGGHWLVNGSAKGLVRLELDPPVRAYAVQVPVRLRELRLSLDQPDVFLAALRKN
ncbi:hypothetical protein [Saccharothrix sp. ST-888]|uniref:hypothetical protein n=1 Tax=Saccharothrix sp. ST-888 TaxID=1427391 RepID=UPI0018CDD8B8|nr:hypothetical protein [Saccharothrix sp. ST-888]